MTADSLLAQIFSETFSAVPVCDQEFRTWEYHKRNGRSEVPG